MPEFTVSESEAGLSLDSWLKRKIPQVPTGYLYQLIKKGRVANRYGKLHSEHLVSQGEILRLPESQRLLKLLEESNRAAGEVAILYESREILIVDKAPGVAVHPAGELRGDTLSEQVKALLKARGESFQSAPIQRLDRETSGPVLFGKGKKSCSELGRLMMAGQIKKKYLALVAGTIDQPGSLETEVPSRGKQKSSLTRYQPLLTNEHATLVNVELVTGRRHQIRRQFADSGHPLIGDRRYGGPLPAALGRIFLHCWRLSFRDPFQGHPITIVSPLAQDLSQFLRKGEWPVERAGLPEIFPPAAGCE